MSYIIVVLPGSNTLNLERDAARRHCGGKAQEYQVLLSYVNGWRLSKCVQHKYIEEGLVATG